MTIMWDRVFAWFWVLGGMSWALFWFWRASILIHQGRDVAARDRIAFGVLGGLGFPAVMVYRIVVLFALGFHRLVGLTLRNQRPIAPPVVDPYLAEAEREIDALLADPDAD